MNRRILLRVLVLAAPPLLLWLWLLVPALQPATQRISGPVRATEACWLWCKPVVSVGGVALSCKADFLGLPYECPQRLLQPGTGSASFFAMPSLGALLGFAPTAGVLLELERDGQLVTSRSVRAQVLASLYGSWGFHALYWPIVGLIIWRWPRSRFSRRVQWQPSRQ